MNNSSEKLSLQEGKVGLVLSGGGAKGAYHVGVLKALDELGAQVDVIAGASIGALNGAILASAPNLKIGIERLEELWDTLAESSPLSPNTPLYINLIVAAGAVLGPAGKVLSLLAATFTPKTEYKALLSDEPLRKLMDKFFDENQLGKGIPLFASVYNTTGSFLSAIEIAAASLGFKDTRPPEYIHIQSLAPEQQKEALLASAALPFIFPFKQINQSTYQDGGIGGWIKNTGNTPITPILSYGVKNVIVTHLSDGSLFNRHDFPDATIIEIRPQKSFERDDGLFGGIKDLLGFKPEKIKSWIDQGYEDTMHCVKRVMDATQARNELKISSLALKESMDALGTSDELDEAMRLLD